MMSVQMCVALASKKHMLDLRRCLSIAFCLDGRHLLEAKVIMDSFDLNSCDSVRSVSKSNGFLQLYTILHLNEN
jgi:hypothetical protein